MSEIGKILALWRSLEGSNGEPVLATVVRVEGSSYRKPGARMLISPDGRRAGTISGGCLEGEVARKAAWHSANGASVQQYSSFFDEESGIPYGLGCGGIVHVLFERGAAVDAILRAISQGFEERLGYVAVSVISSESEAFNIGTHLILDEHGGSIFSSSSGAMASHFSEIANEAITRKNSLYREVNVSGKRVEVYAEYLAAAPGVFIFGAGDDVQPLVEFSHALGWRVTVADGRMQLATPDRFPKASSVLSLNLADPLAGLQILAQDAAVVMTHSYEQDRAILRDLLTLDLRYVGVLGPRKRTNRLMSDLAGMLGTTPTHCLERLRSPVGLDIGAHEPAGIALSIAAEIHASLYARDATPLTQRALTDADGTAPSYCPLNA